MWSMLFACVAYFIPFIACFKCLSRSLGSSMIHRHKYCLDISSGTIGRNFFTFCAHQYQLSSHYRLYAGKTNKAGDKVRVRLLADVKDVGRKGEITLVSSALFNNMLLVKKVAQRISDSELETILAKKAEKAQEDLSLAESFVERINSDNSITMVKKAGSNGQLFGSVTTKLILDEFRSKFAEFNSLWEWKGNGIVEITEEGTSTKVVDIRKVGQYQIVLRVHAELPLHKTRLLVIPEK